MRMARIGVQLVLNGCPTTQLYYAVSVNVDSALCNYIACVDVNVTRMRNLRTGTYFVCSSSDCLEVSVETVVV